MIDYFTTKRDKGILIWLFNIGPEKYWNDMVGYGVKDENENMLVNRMEEMILLLCRPQDYIIMRKYPDKKFLEYLCKLGFSIPRILIPSRTDLVTSISQLVLDDEVLLEKIKIISSKEKEVMFLPYAVTRLEEKIVSICGMNMDLSSAKIAAEINNKISSRKIAQELKLPVTNGIICSNIDEIINAYYKLINNPPFFKNVVIKEPCGSSGKGLSIIKNEIDLELFLRVLLRNNTFPKNVKWLVEGWYEKKIDLNCQMYISKDGSVEIFSIKEQLINKVVCIGSKRPCDLPEHLYKQYYDYCYKIGKCLFGKGYIGFLGIDSFVTVEDVLIPLIELNARFNLSTCISFVDNILGENKYFSKYFNVVTKDKIEFSDLYQILKHEDVLYTRSKKEGIIVYTSGTMPTLQIESSNIFIGRIFILILASRWDKVLEYDSKFANIINVIKYKKYKERIMLDKVEKIKNILSKVLELDADIGSINVDDSLREYSLDSIAAIKLIVTLEKVFGIEVPDNELTVDAVETINNILSLIEKYK